jgi:hypothetical protein
MPGTYGQQWTRYIRPGSSDQHIRVSDAERAEVADRLGVHYSDGRLDRAEFDDRVTRAMSAKTRADLNGLFDDLPDLEGRGGTGTAAGGGPGAPGGVSGPTTPYRVSRHHRGNVRPVLGAVLAIIIVSAAWHALFHFFYIFYIPWFLVLALIVAVVFARRTSGRTRQDR